MHHFSNGPMPSHNLFSSIASFNVCSFHCICVF
uniref:Uncharacterized protein n=1 Tax=Arundo donax TaxID=35708 RepID=A0A0A9HLG5_ARUDO